MREPTKARALEMSWPIVRIVGLEKEGRLGAALGEKSVAAPCASVHRSDSEGAAVIRQERAVRIEYEGCRDIVSYRIVPDQTDSLVTAGRRGAPP